MRIRNYTKQTIWIVETSNGQYEIYASKPKGESIELKFCERAETKLIKENI